jgi:hypothetical protein
MENGLLKWMQQSESKTGSVPSPLNTQPTSSPLGSAPPLTTASPLTTNNPAVAVLSPSNNLSTNHSANAPSPAHPVSSNIMPSPTIRGADSTTQSTHPPNSASNAWGSNSHPRSGNGPPLPMSSPPARVNLEADDPVVANPPSVPIAPLVHNSVCMMVG